MPQRVVVVGGGICGLATAHRLAREGLAVTLLEAGDQLGGLGTFFTSQGRSVERFYHCVMPTDAALLALLDEVGLRESVAWKPTTMGMVVEGEHRSFNSALDLLRFRPLSFADRIRFGVVSLLLRRLGKGKDLDDLRTEDWLRGLYGDRIWELLLAPLFGAKFGSAFGDVPALYVWQRLGRESNESVRGYPAGGYKSVIDALKASIEAHGGEVRTSAPVGRLEATEDRVLVTLIDGETIEADHAVSTVPLPALRSIADPDLAPRLPEVRLPYQGVVNTLFFLRKPLSGHYWAPVIRSGTDFDGVIEMTPLTGSERYGDRHLVYVMHYTDRESALYREDSDSIARRWTEQLLSIHEGLTPDDVDEVRVFKAPFVEPVYPLGYLAQRPPVEVPGTRLRLATTAHVYPNVTSWNSSVELSNSVTDALLRDARSSSTQENTAWSAESAR
ncbi:NAD(P)/FAD-dependent oxidoreductase [Lentzea albida]|uniref:Protoporphyrinogen oxidase n=1 Tax=Lentzea albida TaxID=65499 RepID=A0A1H9PK72_9PSEU|nr:NAD(P)/FAD-dependent oxidoreductase [Lentzea albida]SER48517.1 Protoporphyrinogen oxidase [Lentzea albida]